MGSNRRPLLCPPRDCWLLHSVHRERDSYLRAMGWVRAEALNFDGRHPDPYSTRGLTWAGCELLFSQPIGEANLSTSLV